jgi:cation diffusion facilitator CzcD-associated flavoprotein CzcO
VKDNSLEKMSGRASPPHHGVVVIGAGFGGIAMAENLRRSGITNYVVFEKGDSVGGVWRAARSWPILSRTTTRLRPPSYLDNASGFSLTRNAMIRFWPDYVASEADAA